MDHLKSILRHLREVEMHSCMSEMGQLEALVDRLGLARVLEMLAEVCSEKEEHVRTGWQDGSLAREWRRKSIMVDACAIRVREMGG